jgi:hypothetical protein
MDKFLAHHNKPVGAALPTYASESPTGTGAHGVVVRSPAMSSAYSCHCGHPWTEVALPLGGFAVFRISVALLLAISTQFGMQAGTVNAQETGALTTLWDHNGSVVYLLKNGDNRELHYLEPRARMLQAGAQPGSLLFKGRSIKSRYVGTAYVFNQRCGQTPYMRSAAR